MTTDIVNMTINELVKAIVKRPAAEQYDLAFKVAENIGYRLVPVEREGGRNDL
jgi:hypothetical protein